MGRGVSAGGGQSSLGYLFGGGETSNDSLRASRSEGQISNNMSAAPLPSPPLDNTQQIQADTKSAGSSQAVENSKQGPTGTHDSKKNNYYRPDGQNCGNFITDRPSTKVHAAPGGGSSLGYLFGDSKN